MPCDGAWRMDVAALEAAIEADRAAGLLPFAVVGTAGSTNTGSVDPLREIARVCREQRLWMHVDGAFGARVLLTRHRSMLDGVELADSLSWDAHKWLFQTYSCGMVLVRDRRHLLGTYSAHPEYLRDLEGGAAVNPWDLGPELTRPAPRPGGPGRRGPQPSSPCAFTQAAVRMSSTRSPVRSARSAARTAAVWQIIAGSHSSPRTGSGAI